MDGVQQNILLCLIELLIHIKRLSNISDSKK